MGNIDNRKDEKSKDQEQESTTLDSKSANKEVMKRFYQMAKEMFFNMGFGETVSVSIRLGKIEIPGEGVRMGNLVISKPASVTQITVRP